MATLKIEDVRKSYGHHQVIHGVNVDIEDGEFVVLVGPSGCGKSTLLRMIAGLEEITSGAIQVDGQTVNDLPPKARDIAMVFQNYALYPHMTVAKNMGFSLRLRRERTEVIDAKVKEAAAILGLDHLLGRYPKELSGGQRQRVAMGRAIVRDPKVFLFDEPLSNLDAKLRVQMRAEIKALHQRLRTTTVYVTHDQIEAMTMADKIVVMRDGYVEQVGTPMELYDRPGNRFVASFIGSPAMNFMEGRVEAGGEIFVTPSGTQIRLNKAPQSAVSGSTVLGMRPEDFQVVPDGTEGAFPITVNLVEPTGPEVMVLGTTNGTEVRAVLKDRHVYQPGERINLRPDPSRMHLFAGTENGQRLS
jgi:multiple sugar transport system ATP-binding protein